MNVDEDFWITLASRFQLHIKNKKIYDQMGLSPEVLGWFNIRKFIIHHFNKSKKKNHNIFFIGT